MSLRFGETSNLDWAEVNGVSIRFQWSALSGDAPVLVLIHEMGGSLESWNGVFETLTLRFNVLRYDVRGAGMSEKVVAPCTVDDHANDLNALLDRVGAHSRIALAGIAVGAAVAIGFAAKHAEKVSHLLAMAPACGVAAGARDATRSLADEIERCGTRAAAAMLDRAYPEALQGDRASDASYRARWFATDPRSLAHTLRMLADLQMEESLANLPGRTVFVAGEHDPLRPRSEVERLSAIAEAEVISVPSGHMMSVSSPRLVSALITDYVAANRSAAALVSEFLSNDEHWRRERYVAA